MPSARPPLSTNRKSVWLRNMPCLRTRAKSEPVRDASKNEGVLLANFTVLRIGAAQKQANDPAKQALLPKKEDLEQKIDALKYQKAAMDPADYKQQLTAALVELAQVQQELDK